MGVGGRVYTRDNVYSEKGAEFNRREGRVYTWDNVYSEKGAEFNGRGGRVYTWDIVYSETEVGVGLNRAGEVKYDPNYNYKRIVI